MKIKATGYYYDRALKRHIQEETELDVSDERGKKLIELKLAKKLNTTENAAPDVAKAKAEAKTKPKSEAKPANK